MRPLKDAYEGFKFFAKSASGDLSFLAYNKKDKIERWKRHFRGSIDSYKKTYPQGTKQCAN